MKNTSRMTAKRAAATRARSGAAKKKLTNFFVVHPIYVTPMSRKTRARA